MVIFIQPGLPLAIETASLNQSTLAQAFLSAGAGSVIATLWRVEDRGAAVFASRFYAAHGSGPAPEALAAAQRAMISDPHWSAPYHWAGYRISGG